MLALLLDLLVPKIVGSLDLVDLWTCPSSRILVVRDIHQKSGGVGWNPYELVVLYLILVQRGVYYSPAQGSGSGCCLWFFCC